MRSWACVISLRLFLSLALQLAPTFPIPKDMQETWPGAKLSEADKRLLWKAVAAELSDESEDRDGKKYSFASLDTADIALGSLGKGVIVSVSGSTLCGTGGCPIYAYVREKSRYRKVLDNSFGWAFAIVSSETSIPALAIASNGGGGQIGLSLYRYSGGRFTVKACDTLASKDKSGNPPTSWWDTSEVSVSPCQNNGI